MSARVVLHMSGRYHDTFRDRPHLALHAQIHDLVVSRGGVVELRRRHERLRHPQDTNLVEILESENLHIVDNGLVQHPGLLNTTLAYMPPFFHLHGNGVLAYGPAGQAIFDPRIEDTEGAQHFWDDLQSRFVQARYSRYGQEKQVEDIPKGAIAVFLQGDNPQRQGTAHCDVETMLRTVAAHANGRPVVVKAHPASRVLQDAELLYRLLSEGLEFHATSANIHDILGKCAVTVSYNSAVALEGFLHNKPAILFGTSDFHHLCQNVTDPAAFGTALEMALASDHDYRLYLHWYFSNFCLSMHDPKLDQAILDQFAKAGFEQDRLGMTAGPPTAALGKALDEDRGSRLLSQFLNAQPDINKARIIKPLRISRDSWVYLARINGEKVVVKRFLTGEPAQTVRNLQGELDFLEGHAQPGQFEANRCLFAWPESGIAVLSFAPGEQLGQKVLNVRPAKRMQLLKQAGLWLNWYTSLRRRTAQFGPMFWIKSCAKADLSAVTDPEDQALLSDLLECLRAQVATVKGVSVIQAATHGDFVGMNVHFHTGTIYGVDIQGESWQALSRESARFLIWLAIHDDKSAPLRRHGIAQKDLEAFLSSGVLETSEHTTTLPFFIGEQLYSRFVENYHRPRLRQNMRAAVIAYVQENQQGV